MIIYAIVVALQLSSTLLTKEKRIEGERCYGSDCDFGLVCLQKVFKAEKKGVCVKKCKYPHKKEGD